MPKTVLVNLAKKAKVPVERAEYLWNKSKAIVKSEYGVDEEDGAFWALTTGITKRMLGLPESITFKQFINEEAVKDEPKFSALDVDKAKNIIKNKCSDAMWMFESDAPLIYRGFKNLSSIHDVGIMHVDTSATERRSENTSNYYTVIFDNTPSMKDYPKRSKSFICSASRAVATGFSNGGPTVIIPFNDVKIGVVNKRDIWDTKVTMFSKTHPLYRMNEACWQKIRPLADPTWDDFKNFAADVDAHDPEALQYISSAFGAAALQDIGMTPFLKMVDRAYAPAETGFQLATTKNVRGLLEKTDDTELWVGGDVLVLSSNMYYQLCKDLPTW